MRCPSCGVETSGNYCSSCGSPLKVEKCSSCGAAAPPGQKFCNSCGKPMAGKGRGAGKKSGTRTSKSPNQGGGRDLSTEAAASGNSTAAWWVAGALLVVTLFALGYPALTRDSGPPGGAVAPPGMGGAGGGVGAVDLTTMTLDQQGTLLFNRVMTSSSNGDVGDVEFFLPKALIIYEQINPTDPDGIYHFALLHMVGTDHEAALAKARSGLEEAPDYLLLLGVGAEAAVGLGDASTAEAFYSHLLEVYDTEVGAGRVGYDHHQPMLSAYREAAQSYLGRD